MERKIRKKVFVENLRPDVVDTLTISESGEDNSILFHSTIGKEGYYLKFSKKKIKSIINYLQELVEYEKIKK
ncbi:MAG: hypothetical protein ACOCP4_06355 [Candidatus Woesearchaeota archaeon]